MIPHTYGIKPITFVYNNGQSCCDSHIGVNPGNSPTLSTHCLGDDNSYMSKNSTPTMSDDDEAMNVTSSILNDYINSMERQRERHVRNILIGHLNINSIRNKFEPVHAILSKGLLDIFCITESKLDETFPKNQFSIKDFTLHRKDRNARGGGIVSFIRSDIPQCPEMGLRREWELKSWCRATDH